MNIVFLTLSRFTDISDRGIYPDLVRKFCKEGHRVYVVSPMERKFKKRTSLSAQGNLNILKIWTLNIQKTSNIEKGIAYLMLEYQFIHSIKIYFPDIKFDLILYSTPPITFSRVVRFLKNRDNAKSYLLLKDIFPQDLIDLGIISKKGITYKYFRKAEKELYKLSDNIGCMSAANVRYILENNPEISSEKLEINPNSIEPIEIDVTEKQKRGFRSIYNIPVDATIFAYGGNLGKSQGLDFFLKIMEVMADDPRVFFITVGSGSEYEYIKSFLLEKKLQNAILISEISKDEYTNLLICCDIGLIFLDKNFTIPNFPSRILSYMECKMPVLAATDSATDIGEIITGNGFGHWVLHGDVPGFIEKMELLIGNHQTNREMGEKGHQYLLDNYTVDFSYSTVMKHFGSVLMPSAQNEQIDEKSIVLINQNSGYLMIDIANAFAEAGYKVTLITGLLVQRNTPLQQGIALQRIAKYRRNSIPSRLFSWIAGFFQILFLVRFKHPKDHLFIISNPPIAPLLPLFFRNSFSLLIYDIYLETPEEFLLLKKWSPIVRLWKILHTIVFSKADRIFTLTNGMKKTLEKYSTGKIVEVVPIWTDNTFLKPLNPETNPFVHQYGLKDKFVVMYSGNIGISSGLEQLLEVAAMSSDVDILFAIIGEGIGKGTIEKKARDLNLNNILLLPWQATEMLPYSLAAASLAVVTLPAEISNEAIPSKLFNFLSVGAPILCLAEPKSDLAKLVTEEQIGRVFNKQGSNEIYSFINNLKGNPVELNRLRQNALTLSTEYSKEKNVNKFI